jgi:hypothetical protein
MGAFMKIILGFVLLLIIPLLNAEDIRVRKMLKDGALERSFVLKTNLTDKVVIDCQSFIQGLRIGEYEEAFTFLLDPEECEGLQNRIRGSLRKGTLHCIHVDQEIQSDESCH